MGAKLVKQTGSLVTNCTKDADCTGTKTTTCCFRTQMILQSTTSAGKDEITIYKAVGYASEKDTYTKICNTDYPTTLKATDVKKEGMKWALTSEGNKWDLYCDGGATSLVAGAAAVVALSVSLN